MNDIHNYRKRLESAKRRLAKLKQGKLLLGFLNHLEALSLSTGRVAKYANHICALMKHCPFNPAKAERRDIEQVIAWINGQPYKSSTRDDLKLVVRKLVQYAKCGSCTRETPVPTEVAWFKVKSTNRDCRVRPESLLTSEEIKAMVRAAENERDEALISTLFEGALRPGELLTMKLGSVEFKKDYCIISVEGKTGLKRIPLVVSYRPLLKWLQKHPRRENPNTPLWSSLSNNSKGGQVSYSYLRKLLKRLAGKAGIRKPVWPYLFRHSCLTALAKVFTESRLELYAGWIHGSRMPKRYVHFSARDLEDAVLELHGLKRRGETDNILKIVECPRCGAKNQPDAVRCEWCGLILDKQLALKIEEEERRRTEEKEKALIGRIERLERLVRSLLNGEKHPSGTPPLRGFDTS